MNIKRNNQTLKIIYSFFDKKTIAKSTIFQDMKHFYSKEFSELSIETKTLCAALFLEKTFVHLDENYKTNEEEIKNMLKNLRTHLEKHPFLAYDKNSEFGLNVFSWNELCEKLKQYENPESKKLQEKININLNELLKENLINKNKLETILKHNNINPHLGDMPEAWMTNLHPSTKNAKNKLIQKTFTNFCEKAFSTETVKKELFNEINQQFAETLEKITNLKTNVEFITMGNYGKIFKITTGEDEFALKLFYNRYSENKLETEYHGAFEEVQTAYHASHNNPEIVNEMIAGKLGTEEYESYILSKFLVEDETKTNEITKKNIISDITKYTVLTDTSSENIINGKIIDYGGIKFNKELKDPAIKKLVEEIAPALDNNNVEKIVTMNKEYKDNKDYSNAKTFINKQIKESFINHLSLLKENELYDFPLQALEAFGSDLSPKDLILDNKNSFLKTKMTKTLKVIRKIIKEKACIPDLDDVKIMVQQGIDRETLADLGIIKKPSNISSIDIKNLPTKDR